MKKIVFLGDSITDSEHDRNGGNNLGYGYTSLVSAHLGYEYPGEYSFVNNGIAKRRSIDLYAGLKAEAINEKPDYISILIGVNDVLKSFPPRNDGLSVDKYHKMLSLIAEEIIVELPCARVILMEPFILKGSETERNYEEFRTEIEQRAKMVKKISTLYDFSFVPLQHLFDEFSKKAPASYWLSDGIHPTVAGHEIIKREWIKAFEALKD